VEIGGKAEEDELPKEENGLPSVLDEEAGEDELPSVLKAEAVADELSSVLEREEAPISVLVADVDAPERAGAPSQGPL